MHHTVVIIGAGPAGTSAAMTLASNNIDVCLIDKKEFPRDKLCGGLLTKRSRKIFELIFGKKWDDVVVNKAHGVAFFDKYKFISKITKYSTVYFTQRILFDNYLLNRSVVQGAISKTGTLIKDMDIKKNLIVLENDETLSYDYLIGADGVHSLVAKKLFGQSYDKNTIGFALECEIPIIGEMKNIDVPEIYFNVIKWGYVWVFPKKETLTVGIGGLHRYNKNIHTAFKKFIVNRFGDVSMGQIKGHFIPFGDYRRKAVIKNIFLCGDAAGLVETITGEGIAFAMESGHSAANAIIAKSHNNALDIEKLYTKSHKEITSILRISNILRYLIFSNIINKLFIMALSKSKTLAEKHLDLMADEITYNQYLKYIMKKIVLKPFKIIFSWSKR